MQVLNIIKITAVAALLMTPPCFGAEYRPELIRDELVEKTLQNVSDVYPEPNLDYDYSNINFIPVKIRFLEPITTKNGRNFEGQAVKFETVNNVYDGGRKLLAGGTVGTARIETISPRASMGVPADLIIANFVVGDLNRKKIDGQIVKSGANLTAVAGALKYTVGTVLPGTGYLFMLIKGGQAKINTGDIYEIRYLP